MNNDQTDKILQELEAGYNQVAEKFSDTRKFFWEDLEFIADYIDDGDRVLDFGCGNGRFLELTKDKNIDYLGVDVSEKLIEIAKNKYPEKNFKKISPTKSSISSLKEYSKKRLSQDLVGDKPFPNEFFDKIISIAVFHHFPPEHAGEVAKDLLRMLKPGGKIIITVWNLKQGRFERFREKKNPEDIYIPFKDNTGNTFDRYHRIYTGDDLEEIFQKAGFKKQRLETVSEKNILYIAQK